MALAFSTTAFVSSSSAATLNCGDTISQSTTLVADIGPCPAEGLIIRDDNVVLDMAGHHLFGAIGTNSRYGIIVGSNAIGVPVTNVTVTNGTISEFFGGMFLVGSAHTVTAMTVRNNGGPGTFVGGEGIELTGDDSTVSRSRILNNGPIAGIRVSGARNVIDSNVVQGNDIQRPGLSDHDTPYGQRDIGILVSNRSGIGDQNTVSNNLVQGSGQNGIQVGPYTNGTTVRGNAVYQNGTGQTSGSGLPEGSGIAVYSDHNVVVGNVSIGNRGFGIDVDSIASKVVPPPERLRRIGGFDNEIRGNRALMNGTGPVSGFDLRDTNTACDHNIWADNTYTSVNQPCVKG